MAGLQLASRRKSILNTQNGPTIKNPSLPLHDGDTKILGSLQRQDLLFPSEMQLAGATHFAFRVPPFGKGPSRHPQRAGTASAAILPAISVAPSRMGTCDRNHRSSERFKVWAMLSVSPLMGFSGAA